jgi:hypothetical protein
VTELDDWVEYQARVIEELESGWLEEWPFDYDSSVLDEIQRTGSISSIATEDLVASWRKD